MATTKLTDLIEGTKERAEELHKAMVLVMDGKGSDGNTLAKNTISTTRHHIKKEQRLVALVSEMAAAMKKEGIQEIGLSEAAMQGLNQMCYPEKGGSKVQVKEGDMMLSLMQQYGDVKDLKAKMEKDAEKKGLKLNFKTGKVEKA